MKTRHMSYKTITTVAVAILISAHGLFGQNFTETKKIVKSFKVNPKTTVDITNKYGKVHFIHWETDSVKFIVNMELRSSYATRLEKLKSSIDFDFTATQYYVTAITSIGGRHGNLIDDLIDFADPTSSTGNMIDIDYTIYMPDYVTLEVSNKYGDVYIDDHKGNVNIEMSHGKLKANKFEGATNIIDIKFGDGTINYAENCKMNIFYSDLLLKKAEKLTIDSKSSDVSINEVKTLKINSRRDKFHIDKIESMYGVSTFTDFWLYSLSGELNIDLKYGNLNLESISSGFSFIRIDPKYTDVSMTFERGSTYIIDVTHKNVQFYFPESLADFNQKLDPSDPKKVITYGTIGQTKANAPKVIINAENCNISIIHK